MDYPESNSTQLKHMTMAVSKENNKQTRVPNGPDKMLLEDEANVMTATDDVIAKQMEQIENSNSNNETSSSNEDALISLHKDCELKYSQQNALYEQQLEQIKLSSIQKDNTIMLLKRENAILEKEKDAYRKEKDLANKDKEAIVIKFANKEKLLLDAKKEKETIETQLKDAHKEIKNCTTRFQALNEEKSHLTYVLDEKCNEVRKYQRECEKLKSDMNHLESKLKYHMNKLNAETEAKLVTNDSSQAFEKKLEEERNAPSKLEEKAYEKLKVEYEAQMILLKHESAHKSEQLEILTKDNEKMKSRIKRLEEQLNEEIVKKCTLSENLSKLQEEHTALQNLYSEEMLNSAKLCGQLAELQVLKTQNALNHEELTSLTRKLKETSQNLQDTEHDLRKANENRDELLSINKEISENIVAFQNEICLLKAEIKGITAENNMLLGEKFQFDEKYAELENQLKAEQNQKNEERLLLTKHLSEKTKLYEIVKEKLDNVLGDFDATKHKHAITIKELQREIFKYKKLTEQYEHNNQIQSKKNMLYCTKCCQTLLIESDSSSHVDISLEKDLSPDINVTQSKTHCNVKSSESSESDNVTIKSVQDVNVRGKTTEPSKKNLVERILRLQQASARQSEKIDFLESHTLSLIAELQKKSKVIQYYMLRDQTGALTSTKSDQNKSELAKYGNGVMSAIYNGIKGAENHSMTLELSLEINKKLQAVLEDTLLKNITLKENLDVLGLEVDDLTRKLRQNQIKEA